MLILRAEAYLLYFLRGGSMHKPYKILIFGGGFIGGNIGYTACKKGWEVYISDVALRAVLRDG